MSKRMKSFTTSDVFGQQHIENILSMLGVQVQSETGTHLLCLCPFHGNMNTSAMVVDKELGLFYCNNGSCGASGNIDMMIKEIAQISDFNVAVFKSKALKGIDNPRRSVKKPLDINDYQVREESEINMWSHNLAGNHEAREYLHSRGITDKSIEFYEIGSNYDLVMIPMRMSNNDFVGAIGRSIKEKRFQNTKGLPKALSLWNIQNAKRRGIVNITEASFDSILCKQATGVEGAATLNGHVSEPLVDQLDLYFEEIVLFVDDDDPAEHKRANCKRCDTIIKSSCKGHNPGEDLGFSIAEKISSHKISWAHSGADLRFDGLKDVGDMSPEMIKHCFDQRIPHFRMKQFAGR